RPTPCPASRTGRPWPERCASLPTRSRHWTGASSRHLVDCPRFLFPFARRVIADVTSDGGFPPFLLDPIDFAGVYAARKAQGDIAQMDEVGQA
ncbi:MAG: protein-export chaperone SecB, partial [Oceanibaculum sp.]